MLEDIISTISILKNHLENALNKSKQEVELQTLLEKHREDLCNLLTDHIDSNTDPIIYLKRKNNLLRFIFLSETFLNHIELFRKYKENLLLAIEDDNFYESLYLNFLKETFLNQKCELRIVELDLGYWYATIQPLYIAAQKIYQNYNISIKQFLPLISVGRLIRNTASYAVNQFNIVRIDAYITKMGIGTFMMLKACELLVKCTEIECLDFISEKNAFDFYVKFFLKNFNINLSEFIVSIYEDGCRIKIKRNKIEEAYQIKTTLKKIYSYETIFLPSFNEKKTENKIIHSYNKINDIENINEFNKKTCKYKI